MTGRLCTKANISTLIIDDNIQNNFVTKEILMILFCASILLGFTYFYFFSALKQRSQNYFYLLLFLKLIKFRRFHSIRTLQINLIDLRLQFIFCHLFLIRAILDQALNIFFQIYHKELEKEDIFDIWWLSFYLENIG